MVSPRTWMMLMSSSQHTILQETCCWESITNETLKNTVGFRNWQIRKIILIKFSFYHNQGSATFRLIIVDSNLISMNQVASLDIMK